jgi:hypothetical protein
MRFIAYDLGRRAVDVLFEPVRERESVAPPSS